MIDIRTEQDKTPELVIVIRMEENRNQESIEAKRHELDILAERVFRDILNSLWEIEESGCEEFEYDMSFVSEFIERLTELPGADKAFPVLYSLVKIAYKKKDLEDIERAINFYDGGKETFLAYFSEAATRHYLEGDEEDDD